MKIRIRALGMLCLLCTGMAFGQATNSADVTGTVTDATGAVIPGVTVKVKDLDKGTERVVTTNDAGLYDTGPIVPEDRYTITYSKEGFSSLQRGPLVLRVGVIGLNIQLGVGTTTQQVVVNDAAPLLETTTAELSATLPSEQLQVLPQTGTPDWQSFIILQPGTRGVPQNGNNVSNPGMGGVSANGSMPFSNALLDGASTSSPMSNNVINTPIFDVIGEVKMSDSLFSAQYGTGGVLYNQISKGGSNTIHGLVYDYFRNKSLNAASYGFGSGRIPALNYHDTGYQVSGPVIKNKVFFLFDYDHVFNHGASAVTFISVPTTAMRNGDFTGQPTLYDPTSQVIDPVTGVVTRQSYAAEFGNGNKIPAAQMDAVAKNIQAYFPTALDQTKIVNNYNYVAPSQPRLSKWFGRFDADPFSSHHVSGSVAYNYTITPGFGPVQPIGVTNNDVENMNSQISDVWTISPTTINEARAGFMGEYDLIDPATKGTGWPTKLGLNLAGKENDIFPVVNISSFYTLQSGVHANYKENLFDLSDVVTLVRGRHVLHLGGNMVIMRADSTAWGNIVSANVSFTGVYTQGLDSSTTINKPIANTGSPYADFLLGYTRQWSALFSPEYGGRLKNPAAFVQDDFKVTPKLTLNLGLRWDGRTGWSDSTQNERMFDPTLTNPATNTLGAMWYAQTAGGGRTQIQKNKMNVWLPRIGAAYQMGDKTTIRGGFGIYTFPWNVDTYASSGLGNARSKSGNETDSTGGIKPVTILSSDGNTNYQGTKGKSVNSLYVLAPTAPDSYNGQQVNWIQYDSPVPYLYAYNFTIQRQITNDTVVNADYVGSIESNLAFNTDLNQIPESKLGPTDSSSRPYSQYQSILGLNTQGHSDYNALQGGITRRMNGGLMFNMNYTYSHMTSNQDSSGWGSKQGTTVWQRAYDPVANHGASNFDIRHMFKTFAVYDLPFGQGRKFLNSNAIADVLVGGWTLSGTFILQGGNPFTPFVSGADNSYSLTSGGGYAWFPNQVKADPKAGAGTIAHWFDTTAFASPAAGSFGNTRRNSIYGPGLNVVNLAVRKTFKIYERVSFDFSANATNAFNHASFGQPDLQIGGTHQAAITTVAQGGRNIELIGKLRF
jgi:hypothetical protein